MLRRFAQFVAPSVFVLALFGPVYAQEPAEPPPVVEDNPLPPTDTSELFNNLENAAQSAEVVLAVISFLVIQFLKFVVPKKEGQPGWDARKISIATLGLFSAAFLLANATGYVEQFNTGVDVAKVIAEPLRVLLAMWLGSTGLYTLNKAANVPVLGDRQGEKTGSLVPHAKA